MELETGCIGIAPHNSCGYFLSNGFPIGGMKPEAQGQLLSRSQRLPSTDPDTRTAEILYGAPERFVIPHHLEVHLCKDITAGFDPPLLT